ncbi:MAG: PilZ domain-containing protein [Aquificaceae bacterium]|nr:PilZ domain-containing protein [Aquificaceae bacterium]
MDIFLNLASNIKEPSTLLKEPERFTAMARGLLKSNFELSQDIYELKTKLGFTKKDLLSSNDIDELQPGFLLVEGALFKAIVWQNCHHGVVLMLDKIISRTSEQKQARFTFLKENTTRFCLNTNIIQADGRTAILAHSNLEPSKARAFKRVSVNIPAKVLLTEELTATVTDLSLGGAGLLLNSNSSPSIGSSLLLRLPNLELKGVVKHCRKLENKTFIGIQFQNLDGNSTKVLTSILSRGAI